MHFYNTTDDKTNQELQILDDRAKNGKQIDWRSRKQKNMLLADMLFELNLKKAVRVDDCGARLEFIKMPDGQQKLYKAYFCKDKMCPMCSWKIGRASCRERV